MTSLEPSTSRASQPSRSTDRNPGRRSLANIRLHDSSFLGQLAQRALGREQGHVDAVGAPHVLRLQPATGRGCEKAAARLVQFRLRYEYEPLVGRDRKQRCANAIQQANCHRSLGGCRVDRRTANGRAFQPARPRSASLLRHDVGGEMVPVPGRHKLPSFVGEANPSAPPRLASSPRTCPLYVSRRLTRTLR